MRYHVTRESGEEEEELGLIRCEPRLSAQANHPSQSSPADLLDPTTNGKYRSLLLAYGTGRMDLLKNNSTESIEYTNGNSAHALWDSELQPDIYVCLE
jgi:hypothetical protein